MSSDLERLCQSCGFCCDGTLYGRALLRAEEVETAKRIGLRVIENGKGFEQPCPQLKVRSCGVYVDRPSVCRSFECNLFARHREEGGPLEPRLEVIQRVRELKEILERHGLERSADGTEVSFKAEGMDAFEAMQALHELMTTIEEHFSRFKKP